MWNFVDRIELVLKSGDGGAGSSSFRREKFVPKGGPDGGDGGKGGDIIVQTSVHDRTLRKLRHNKVWSADNGDVGTSRKRHGKNGPALIIRVPVGTVVKDAFTKYVVADLRNTSDECVLLRGGIGGRGNVHFKSSTRQSPTYAQPGIRGVERRFIFELELYSDISFIGMPNVGKSSLLKVLTNADPKIANYPFTTLIPNLGTLIVHNREIVLSDIPGITGGASKGRGLGLHFLRHIRRTRVLAYVLDSAVKSVEDIFSQYVILRKEVENYYRQYTQELGSDIESRALLEKESLIIVSRLDISELGIPKDKIQSVVEHYIQKKYKPKNDGHVIKSLCISAHAKWNIDVLKNMLYDVIQNNDR